VDISELLPTENSLPSIDATGSTTAKAGLPAISAPSPLTYAKFGLSGLMGLLGMYYLAAGKKQHDVEKMLIGAALTLGSFFLF